MERMSEHLSKMYVSYFMIIDKVYEHIYFQMVCQKHSVSTVLSGLGNSKKGGFVEFFFVFSGILNNPCVCTQMNIDLEHIANSTGKSHVPSPFECQGAQGLEKSRDQPFDASAFHVFSSRPAPETYAATGALALEASQVMGLWQNCGVRHGEGSSPIDGLF